MDEANRDESHGGPQGPPGPAIRSRDREEPANEQEEAKARLHCRQERRNGHLDEGAKRAAVEAKDRARNVGTGNGCDRDEKEGECWPYLPSRPDRRYDDQGSFDEPMGYSGGDGEPVQLDRWDDTSNKISAEDQTIRKAVQREKSDSDTEDPVRFRPDERPLK